MRAKARLLRRMFRLTTAAAIIFSFPALVPSANALVGCTSCPAGGCACISDGQSEIGTECTLIGCVGTCCWIDQQVYCANGWAHMNYFYGQHNCQ